MRDGSTYRGARRNKCLRELKTVWGPHWYYEKHDRSSEKIGDAKRAKKLRLKQIRRETVVKARRAMSAVGSFLRRGGARGQ